MSFNPDFENLVKLYYRDLYRFGLSLTASEADAADLTQETFYIWANKGHQLKNPVKVKAWLFTTLHRQFLQTRRHQMRFQNEPIDEASADFTHVPAQCVDRIDAQTLLNFLGQLDENHRAPLALYYLEDLSYNEIAETLAVPLGTVQSRIARAKIKLLQLLNHPPNHRQKMTTSEAKQILLLYRGSVDDSDPQFRAALDYAKSDPELGKWLREQTNCYDTIRAKLRGIEPPIGLSEKIVRNRPIAFPRDWSRIGQLAAAILISASITMVLVKWIERSNRSFTGAQEIVVTGEVLDMTCYIADNLSGPDHAKCARDCIRSGLPAGLKAKD